MGRCHRCGEGTCEAEAENESERACHERSPLRQIYGDGHVAQRGNGGEQTFLAGGHFASWLDLLANKKGGILATITFQ